MKQITAHIPADKLKIVQELADRMALDPEISVLADKATLITVVENNKTAIIIEELKAIGVGSIFGSIIVAPIDIEISSHEARPSRGTQFQGRVRGKGISLDEMIVNFGSLGRLSSTYLMLAFLASTLAGFGLRYDSVVITIASMIIAPFLGPIAFSVISTMIPEKRHRGKGILAEIVGLLLCVCIGFGIGTLLPLPASSSEIPEQIMSRTAPGFGDVMFAILSGLAAGIFIVRGESTSIVGVAVAASLCPPATNIGILLANGRLEFLMGSLELLLLNVLSIYMACAVIFWISQSIVRGGTVSSRQFKKISKRYYVQIGVAIVVLTGIIVFILQ
ncbi:MAG: TIGR00341 family protein [Candidatus Lokiarchaeota archaeon]|nr:TIGR00341 family protein [Candidatus Lokiarchaeota archaeon]